ncbi:MAG: hypothetical protein ACI9OJ_002925, partial [Myxococcota bacterium]
MKKPIQIAAVLALLAGLCACSGDAEVVDTSAVTEEAFAVPLGKEDNFFSDSAREFLVEGRTSIVLDDAD